MKNLLLLLLLPFINFAQKDSVTLSFSEETVEKFEKTKLLDEYEKAFGGNKIVRSALKVGMSYRNLSYGSGLQAKFETKISSDKSLAISITGPENNLSFDAEGRWYFRMKERVKDGLQGSNLTGEYLSLRYEYNNIPNRMLNISIDNNFQYLTRSLMFLSKANLSLNYGRQFGNNFDFYISGGIMQGGKSQVNSQQEWISNAYLGQDFNLFLSSKTFFGLGLNLPKNKKISANSCDFLMCNYKTKQLIKIPLNSLFYLDRYNQNINLGIGYERKIANSAFSVNSDLALSFNRIQVLKQIGERKSTEPTFTLIDGTKIYSTTYLYSSEIEKYASVTAKLNEQLRWYVGMNNRIKKGKSASNLNGIYTGLNLILNAGYHQVRYSDINNKYASVGLLLGYQSKISTKSYLDAGFSINNNQNQRVDLYVKFGFAK